MDRTHKAVDMVASKYPSEVLAAAEIILTDMLDEIAYPVETILPGERKEADALRRVISLLNRASNR